MFAYAVKHSGLLVKEDNDFIRIFHHNCQGLTNKERIIHQVEGSLNKNEIAEIYHLQGIHPKIIVYGKAEFFNQFFGINKDMMVIQYENESYMSLYDISFKPISKNELKKLMEWAEKNQKEFGVTVIYGKYTIFAIHSKMLLYIDDLNDNLSISRDFHALLIITNRLTGKTEIYPLKWRTWTKEYLIQEANKYIDGTDSTQNF